jgi:DNA-binding NarL/FixJ family response regulator
MVLHGSRVAFPLRIVVVADHAEIRRLVCLMLHRPPEWELVGEAGDGMVGVELVKQLQPHVVIMDIEPPVLDGIAATKQITSSVPHARVIAFSSHMDTSTRTAMHEAGSVAFVPKHDIFTLPDVIEEIVNPSDPASSPSDVLDS